MKQLLLFAALFTAACVYVSAPAKAEDTDKERAKVKEDLLLPECSWSKMSKEEYDACQKKRRTLKVMTPAERAKYLDHTEGTTIVDNDRGGLVRNKIIVDRNRK